MKDDLILGIELGSTRIKSVVIEKHGTVLATGISEWENQYMNGYWTYSLESIMLGLQESYSNLRENFFKQHGYEITELKAIGISAMMHGYIALDEKDDLLVPFRTWRNTTTSQAASELSKRLQFNIPERWSVAHYYQAVLNEENHIPQISYLTTLAGFIHYKLTGKKVIGIGDASGMFPIKNCEYDKDKLRQFNTILKEKNVSASFESLLPEILLAGNNAGYLTDTGAKLLDKSGNLKAGALLCPPEGDAGTGMIATNSIAPCTANVSAGTSAFLMAVLEKPLQNVYKEIDVVTTPLGNDVAMVHINNCTSEINAWSGLFEEVIALTGYEIDRNDLMTKLFNASCESDNDSDKLIGYNFLSGEPIAGISDGRPLIIRHPECKLTLANFMRMQIYSALASLRLGMEILYKEKVTINCVCGHGGFFKTKGVGQSVMAAVVNAPVNVFKNASEGGAWGSALLALFALEKGKDLQEFLNVIFKEEELYTITPNEKEKQNFSQFMESYKSGLKAAKLAAEVI